MNSLMDSLPRSHLSLLILLLYLLFAKPTSADNTDFNFATFSLRNLTLLGDSYLRNGSIGLTRETDVPSSSSGTAACNFPVMFHDPRTNVSASFSTKFTFSITNPSNPSSSGDGMAFFLSSEKFNLGNTGGFLGLFNSSTVGDASKPVVAVEFDTRLDEGFGDVSSNHVGFDVGGPWSMNATDLGDFGIDLRNGSLITAWVEYDNTEKMVRVWLNYSSENKPERPVLAVNYDLSKHFEDYMYVGFSASKEGSTEVHNVEDWTFQTSGFTINPNVSSLVPRSNSSDSSWTVMPSLSVSSSDYHLHKKLSLGLGIAGPIAFCMLFVVIVWGSIKKKFNDGMKKTNKVDSGIVVNGPREFSYKELIIATRGFHCSRVLGNGSFGTVYRAIQPGSCITYAVKRSKHSHQSKSEFMAELSIIARLRHKNLVQLQGWCDEKGELLLVYEFMPNGSLDKVLYKGTESVGGGSSSSSMFKWAQRYNAAVGIASVLMYLHEECEQQVIHRDIKTSNIMLDVNFNPRLGDFGLARLMEHNESPVSTLTAGTLGYLAPEYVQYGKATEKTDVFSFGVVILEVCCGRRPIDKDDDSNNKNLVNLVDWVWFLYANDRLIEAADPRLRSEFNKEEMVRLLMVGLSCASPDCEARPSMRKVIQILNFEMEPLQVPRLKPCMTFSLSLPRSLGDIVSDGEESSGNTSPLQELKINL